MKEKKIQRNFRLFGCRFSEYEFEYLNKKIEEIKKNKKISNSEILLELFKTDSAKTKEFK